MPPKAVSATVEEFDDDTEFDLPTLPSSNASGGARVPQNEADQLAAFQNMMGQMGQLPAGSGDFGSTRPPQGVASAVKGAAGDEEYKKWVSVYPIYFDAKRHFGKGCRRVAYEKASLFPIELWIAKAVGRMNFLYVQEPYKTHPQDWENPGRVKVKLFGDDGEPLNAKISNKKQLFDAIAEIMQPNCGGTPPPLKPRTKRTKPAALKKSAEAANAATATSSSLDSANKKKGSKGGKPSEPKPTAAISKPTLTIKQKREIANAKRNPNPNPIRERLTRMKFPPRLQDRLPAHSPALEGGLLNMNLAEAMGGMPGGADQLGPLGGMLSSMGLGGGDDDEDDEEEQEQEDELTLRKKALEKQFGLGRRQRKKVVRIGR